MLCSQRVLPPGKESAKDVLRNQLKFPSKAKEGRKWVKPGSEKLSTIFGDQVFGEALGGMTWSAASAAAAVLGTLQPGPLLAIGTLLVSVRRHFIVLTCVFVASSSGWDTISSGSRACSVT